MAVVLTTQHTTAARNIEINTPKIQNLWPSIEVMAVHTKAPGHFFGFFSALSIRGGYWFRLRFKDQFAFALRS